MVKIEEWTIKTGIYHLNKKVFLIVMISYSYMVPTMPNPWLYPLLVINLVISKACLVYIVPW